MELSNPIKESLGRIQEIALATIKQNEAKRDSEIDATKTLYDIAETKERTKKLGLENMALERKQVTEAEETSDKNDARDLEQMEKTQKYMVDTLKLGFDTGDIPTGGSNTKIAMEALRPFAIKYLKYSDQQYTDMVESIGTKKFQDAVDLNNILINMGADRDKLGRPKLDELGNPKFTKTFDLNDGDTINKLVRGIALARNSGNTKLEEHLTDIYMGRIRVGEKVAEAVQKKTMKVEDDTRTANVKNLEYARDMVGKTYGGVLMKDLDTALSYLGKSSDEVKAQSAITKDILKEYFKDNVPDIEKAIQKTQRILEDTKDPKYKKKVVSDSLLELRSSIDPNEQKVGTKKEVQDLGSGKILTYEVVQKPDGSKDWKLAPDRKWVGQQKLGDIINWVIEQLKSGVEE